jgi:hypothetical protein
MKMKICFMALAAGLMITLSASAAEMLFSLGDLSGDMNNSPAISASAVASGSVWNRVSKATGESPAPLKWADGSIALPTVASCRTFRGTNSPAQTINGWSTIGGNGFDFAYADRSGIMSGPGGTGMGAWQATAGFGAALPAGTYDVYVSAVTNIDGNLYTLAVGDDVDVYIGVAPINGADIYLPGMAQSQLTTLTHDNYDTWQLGDNYAVGTVTVDGAQRIIVGTDLVGKQGLICSVEIVEVPEPATMALMGLGSLVMLRRRK